MKMTVNSYFKLIVEEVFNNSSSAAVAYFDTFFIAKSIHNLRGEDQCDIWHLCNLSQLPTVTPAYRNHWFWINAEYILDEERACPRCGERVPKQFLMHRRIMNIGV